MGGLNQSIILNTRSPSGPEALRKSPATQGIGPLQSAVAEMTAFLILLGMLLPFVDGTGFEQGASAWALVTFGAE